FLPACQSHKRMSYGVTDRANVFPSGEKHNADIVAFSSCSRATCFQVVVSKTCNVNVGGKAFRRSKPGSMSTKLLTIAMFLPSGLRAHNPVISLMDLPVATSQTKSPPLPWKKWFPESNRSTPP